MRKLVWLLALLCLAPAYYSCSNAQTPPVQSSNVAAPPTTLGNEPTLIDSSQNKNSAIETIEVYPPDPITGGQINVVHNKDQSYALVFKDAKTQKVLQTLTDRAIRNLNPYYNLPFKSIEDTQTHALDIDMTNVPVAKKNELINYMHKDKYQTNYTLKQIGVDPIRYSRRGQLISCSNTLYCYNEEGGLFGTQSDILLFDATGKQYAHLNDKEYGIANFSITDNGKYLMKGYGELWGEDANMMEMGFRLYELPSGKLIGHFPAKSPDGKEGLSSEGNFMPYDTQPLNIGNLFRIETHYPDIELFILDPSKKCYYFRSFTADERGKFKEFTSEGIVLINNKFLSYTKDFEKHNF